MKEIEMKFKLDANTSFDSVVETLYASYGFEAEPKIQRDVIYLLPEQVGQPIVEGSRITRVRTVTKQGVTTSHMTLKVQTDKPLVSDEYEFGVTDPTTAEAFLANLGFQRNVVVRKKRAEARIDNYTVCVDEVDKLGVFVELETLAPGDAQEDIGRVQREMQQFLGQLGLHGEISTTTYDTQVREYDRSHAEN